MAKMTKSQKAWKNRQLQKGLCQCCNRPVKPGRKHCEYHLEKARENTKKRQAAWQTQGLCIACGKCPPVQGKVHCAKCNARYSTPEHKARRKELHKIRIKAKKEAGICIKCKQPVVPGHTVCKYHLKYASGKSQERQEDRRSQGLCPYCGKESIPGSKQCEDCRKRHLVSRRRNNCDGNWIPAVERDEWMCRLCGSLKQLCVHHIDGQGNDSEHPNHDLDNLITLCKPCHNNITKLRYHTKDKQLVAKLILA